MQIVKWNDNLSFLSQRDVFHELVLDITSHNFKAQFLHEEVEFVIPAYRGEDADLELAARAKFMWQKYWPAGTLLHDTLYNGDEEYIARDKSISRDCSTIFRIANMLRSGEPEERKDVCIYTMLAQVGNVQGFDAPCALPSLSKALTLDIRAEWPSLLRLCYEAKGSDHPKLLFTISLVVFGHPDLLSTLTILLSFALLPEMKELPFPAEAKYNLAFGHRLDWSIIQPIIDACRLEDVNLGQYMVSQYDGVIELEDLTDSECVRQEALIKNSVRKAWPYGEVKLPSDENLSRFDAKKLRSALNGRVGAWSKNNALRQICDAWEMKLRGFRRMVDDEGCDYSTTAVSWSTTQSSPRVAFPPLLQILENADVPEPLQAVATNFDMSIQSTFQMDVVDGTVDSDEATSLMVELRGILKDPVGTQDQITQRYRKGLLDSTTALEKQDMRNEVNIKLPDLDLLGEKLSYCTSRINALVVSFNQACTPKRPSEQALHLARLWPEATRSEILLLLSRKFRDEIPKGWKIWLVDFAREIAAHQRIERLIRFLEHDDKFALENELTNTAHESWDPQKHLDWLLLEIQNDFLIRPTQVTVTRAMLEPQSQFLQMQLGAGKSSVIMPMFCASAPTGSNLVRVVVLKSLEKEALRSLSKAISGLVQIPLYWLPFSRSTTLTSSTTQEFRSIWKECMNARGVILALPEHINSFRLIGNDQATTDRCRIASSLHAAQKWLDLNTRDIIDESDHALRPQWELVYTNGEDKPLSGTPYRWTTLLSIFDIVHSCARQVHECLPHGLSYKYRGPGQFATVRIIDDQARDALLHGVLDRVVAGDIPGLPFDQHDASTVQSVISFIQQIRIDGGIHQLVKKSFSSPGEMAMLHLLRGLFAWGYLAAALRKRFNIDYGLDRERCLCAVPYRAKGVPATAAEFAQPDMMILLTALSYYYAGLELDDTRRALAVLTRMSDPHEEWRQWVSNSAIAKTYVNISGINVQDETCVPEIHHALHRRKAVIDFFLKSVVLVKESKEYPFKLSSSAWDLCAGADNKITCGFSGTTDSLMPTSMPQKHLADLMHFDAEVLRNLLSLRNRQYLCGKSVAGMALESKALLQFICSNVADVSVIIDVGAQLLDKNEHVARMWLDVRPDKLAVIFFDEQDNKQVVTAEGDVVSLVSSPFKDQINRCLIYLDQYHTRGTDFSLPDDFKAAVLLGPGLQKDAWVQACMRMRKLSRSQSCVTIAPPEVDHDIRKLLAKGPDEELDIADVIKWTIRQSCDSLQGQLSLHTMRGLEFLKRSKAFERQVSNQGFIHNRTLYLQNVRTKEENSVESLYPVGVNSLVKPPTFSKHERNDKEVIRMLKEAEQIDKIAHVENSKHEEQERELLHEVEEEKEVQLPKSMNPKYPAINKHLYDVLLHDRDVQTLPQEIVPAFELMGATSLFRENLRLKWPKDLVATRDFLDTVKSATSVDLDDFLRPVHWLLKLKRVHQLILLCPHEVHAYMPFLRRSANATLITYSARITRETASFDNLDVYTVPTRKDPVNVDPNILTCLRVFAGQLYFNNFDEYKRFCVMLGLKYNGNVCPRDEEGTPQEDMLRLSYKTANKPNFVPMLKKWIDMRRKGVEWGHTHVGRVLNGEKLYARDFV